MTGRWWTRSADPRWVGEGESAGPYSAARAVEAWAEERERAIGPPPDDFSFGWRRAP